MQQQTIAPNLQPTPAQLHIIADQYDALRRFCRGPQLAAAWAKRAKALREEAARLEQTMKANGNTIGPYRTLANLQPSRP